MKKTIKLFSLLASIALAGVSPALADGPAAPTVTVNGLVDTYYTYNFTNGANANLGVGNVSTFFNTDDDSFALGLAEVDVNVVQGQVAGHISLDYGQESNLGLAGAFDVLQAYVTYTPSEWSFSAGRFVTWMGNEVIQSKSNMNYSRSLLFWYTIPLWHQGLTVGYASSDSKFAVTGYLVDGWNNTMALRTGKDYGLQLKIVPDSTFSIILNGIFGPNGFGATSDTQAVGEAIISYAASDKFSLALDAEYGMQNVTGATTTPSFWGVALYGRYQMESDWALALRLEDMTDSGVIGFGTTTTSGSLYEGTLTLEHNFTPNMLVRWEGRYDTNSINSAAAPIYANGLATSQFTGTMAAVFSF